jgi:hypothetical protein
MGSAFRLVLLSRNHHNQPPAAQAACRPPSTPAFGRGVALRAATRPSFQLFHNQFFDGTGAPLGCQAAGANSRRCSFNCSFSTSMLRYRMASTQSS